jgi:L-fuculose-phosphate aldolase
MIRTALMEVSRRCARSGLNHGATGNLSVRIASGLLITPSGVPPETLTEQSMIELAPDGLVRGPGNPSSEWRLHAAIYTARPDAGAIVHTHPPFATSIACLRQNIPRALHDRHHGSNPCAAAATRRSEPRSSRRRSVRWGRPGVSSPNAGW